MTRTVGVLLRDKILLQEVADLAKCFDMANLLAEGEIYRLVSFSRSAGEVFSFATWLTCTAAHGIDDLPEDIGVVLIPPAERSARAAADTDFTEFFLSRTDLRRVCAWGNGVVLAAACGLAGERKIACEPADVPRIMLLGQNTAIEPFADSCHSGSLSTWVGSSRARDVVLALVEEDFGPAFAQELARRLGVMDRMEKLVAPAPSVRRKTPVDRVQDWVRENPQGDLSVTALAKMVSMTERTLSRTFKDRTGQTIGGYILGIRLGYACNLLSTTDRKIKEVARLSGLGSQANMRQVFMTKLGKSPSSYRTSLDGRVSGEDRL
ncbi:helix-turn-helix domain-containing protein [Neorhizobium alkalisoli]|uniref:Transcriptional regulator GlxA family with amidase domain n=1 Tax=Neorhizobium alkalisoli TaxID=528178 RepID=A0A561R8W5_9HYPH|nr:helix-turn-helix domain-containing protein [Neorhizobium alkalisoli]TWF59024.1 transcriptional regulator GlxA family with amidase domain [Neorhizobium alkalisoli]